MWKKRLSVLQYRRPFLFDQILLPFILRRHGHLAPERQYSSHQTGMTCEVDKYFKQARLGESQLVADHAGEVVYDQPESGDDELAGDQP